MPDSFAGSSSTEAQPQKGLAWEDAAMGPSKEWERDRQRNWHWTMLWGTMAVVALAFAMQVKGETQVAFGGLSDYPLPELCGSRSLLGIDCPGCGLTRSVLALTQGDWERSLAFHRIGWVIALAILGQIPYRIYRLKELKSRVPDVQWPQWFGACLLALLVINWLYECIG